MYTVRGFTLIEVLITIAIVAILASVALPAYNDYITRSKIAEAHALLSEQRVRMEQYFQDNRTYVDACDEGTVATPQAGEYFDIDCGEPTATTYTLTATGKADKGVGDFVFTVNERNQRKTVKVASGWNGTNSNCWVKRKDGSC
ncbi:MAG: prepilin-type N-terminal cleavage/methylation domain-containing protein [Burkholderiales bacterium]|nr:prepilin-type N-terminal cleavage/methylation domain-containing protein [Burkholderiales bacterium]PZM99432.1 MAG: prepilin-type cleavage/methylation domain-containing protein [Pseudomonadota bacterium]